ncbi:YbgC/FadM family acyl-CoA thioesterase [Campylobacter sp. RM15925]|uniref:YbgC/FadM family acyl-CoA thioesterase n=1 Tax=Campylobacter sp. RM15925 TaxID=1705724 RepID=UPI00147497A3|nr:YbgC/FadM family acyl-CoA thioesterase [Campylobacter sp. RM15925]
MKFRIYYEDTDAAGIVYHANYIKFCERARSEAFFNSDLEPFSKDGYFVVSEIHAKFKKPATLGDMIEVRSKAVQVKKVSVVINQQIYKVGNLKSGCEPELLFEADVTVAFMNEKGMAKMSEQMLEFISSRLLE